MKPHIRLPQGSIARAAERKDMDLYWDKKYEETKKALQDQICKEMDSYAAAHDATVLWALHVSKGWGAKRLRDFWEDVIRVRLMFRSFRDSNYKVQPTGENIEDFALTRYLLDIGVDLVEWERETIQYDEDTGEVTFAPYSEGNR